MTRKHFAADVSLMLDWFTRHGDPELTEADITAFADRVRDYTAAVIHARNVDHARVTAQQAVNSFRTRK